MVLDPTARESNFRDSWKKYLSDNLESNGIHISFDKSLTTPKIQGREVKRWVSISFLGMRRETLSEGILEMRCCKK